MKLENYLQLKGITRKKFAKMIGVSPQTISNYLQLKRKPTLEISCKIEIVTGGYVTIWDFTSVRDQNAL